MNTQTETLKKLEALLLLVSEVMRDIPQNILSEAAKELQQKLKQSDSVGPTDEATIKKMHDVIWLTSQMYKDLNHQELSEAEQKLVAALQEGGFLTKDPVVQEIDLDFSFGFDTNLNLSDLDPVDEAVSETDVRIAQMLAGANWHSLTTKMVAESTMLQIKGLLGKPVRQPGGDFGYLRCTVGEYIHPQ